MPHSAETIFAQARALAGHDRATFIQQACAGDEALRAQVSELLEADARSGRFLRTAGAGRPTAAPGESIGDQIGRYRLLQLIGEGGFGAVYMAEQREPVKRKVALKIIKLGMDTRQVIARFEAERQALAMMDHPNIAKVFDAGATETGRPYFVMELVKGVPITEYCDTESLPTQDRLALFTSVCHAVQHAHQKGVIHRDLKPSNVMVTLHDGRPVPKVIDFGIAKATNRELTDKTLFTEYRQLIGTPEYMSPEQAEMSGLDIDTRSDIYSLGVLLYELLSGVTPFDGGRLRSAALAEIQRIIREEEPPRPSTRVSEVRSAAGAPKPPALAPEGVSPDAQRTSAQYISRHRRTDAGTLVRQLRGDLDWIVMKCLEKDRQRRYETADGLARDIQRHLDDEPVLAGPPGAMYRLRKYVRRNRAQVVVGMVVAIALVLGTVVATSGMVWALREKGRADREAQRATDQAEAARAAAASEAAARRVAQENEERAVEEAERAESALREAQAVSALIDDMFTSANPHAQKGVNYTVRQLLDEFGRTMGSQLEDQPLVEASLRRTVGSAYLALGLPQDARVHWERALALRTATLGEQDSKTLDLRQRMIWMTHDLGEYDEAERQAAALLADIGDRGDLAWLRIRTTTARGHMLHHLGRAREAEPLLRANLEASSALLGEEDATTLAVMGNLAAVCRDLGHREEAVRLYSLELEVESRTSGEESPSTLTTMHNLAMVLDQLGRRQEASHLYERALDIRRRLLGEKHPDTLRTMQNLAASYDDLGRIEEAIALGETVVAGCTLAFGAEHAETLSAKNNLGVAYLAAGRLEEARAVLEETLEVQRRVLGPDEYATLGTEINLANLAVASGGYEDAITRYQSALATLRARYGTRYQWTRNAMQGLAEAHEAFGPREQAQALWAELLELSVVPAERADASPGAMNNAAWSLLTHTFEELRDPARALALAERACRLEEASDGPDLWVYLDTLALAQHLTGEAAKAVRTQRRAVSLMPSPEADPSMHERLAEYEAALEAGSPDLGDAR